MASVFFSNPDSKYDGQSPEKYQSYNRKDDIWADGKNNTPVRKGGCAAASDQVDANGRGDGHDTVSSNQKFRLFSRTTSQPPSNLLDGLKLADDTNLDLDDFNPRASDPGIIKHWCWI